MPFYSDVFRFRGEGAIVPWESIRKDQDEGAQARDPEQHRRRIEATQDRFADIQLRWMVSPTLGVPNRPFHVFRRHRKEVPLRDIPLRAPRTVTFERVAAVIEVELNAPAGSTVLLSASRVGAREDDDGRAIEVREIVAATAREMPASGTAVLRVRCSGATVAQISAGSIGRVSVAWLDDVLDLPDWEEIEIVGLPFDVGNYQAGGQGLIVALTDPVSAAIERLQRGSPPIGWFPTTQTSLIAPDWFAPDPLLLVEEVTNGLIGEVEPLFDGRPAHEAAMHEMRRDATPAGSTLEAVATVRPFEALTLPPSAEGPLALALGFGTAYAAADGDIEAGATDDYLILATYDDEIPDSGGHNKIATFIPSPALHQRLTAPQILEIRSAGLDAPEDPNLPWRADTQAIWAQVPASAGLERPTGAAFARTEAGAPKAESLLPKRDAGGARTLLPTTTTSTASPPPAGSTPPRIAGDRLSLVDGGIEIPTTAGMRDFTYSVALVDLYGVWSSWEDRDHVARAPAPPRAGVVDVSMVARFADQPAACPATTTVDLIVDWETRTPTIIHLHPVLFPTTRTGDSPGARPPVPVGPPATAIPMMLQFAGDELLGPTTTPPGITVAVEHVDEEGEQIVTPGITQGEKRRRYRVRLSHLLDYTATRWWGVEVWARTDLAVGPASTWVPTPPPARPPHEYAMSARAASPVPPSPPVIPQGPDVPLGSTLDAQGRSHTRIPINFSGATPRKVSVWEVSEAALRTAGGLAQQADDTVTPSQRLVQLRAVYDALSPARRRAIFRRAMTLDAGVPVADVALPRGSTDIHFFSLTATTAEGVESDWPQGGSGTNPHEYLHAVMAPRLVSPAPPQVRITLTAAGPEVQLSCLSRIPVSRFESHATRSSAASRAARSMGPPVASPAAALDTSWSPDIPAEQGMQRYTATVGPALTTGWDPWFLRAVAVPVDALGQLGLRGMRSPDSPVTSLDLRPTDGPIIAPVSGRSIRTNVVAFNTSTDALARSTSAGDFHIRVRVESGSNSQTTATIPLADVLEVADPAAQPSAIPSSTQPPLVVRGPRSGGRTPLGVWWQRPDPDRPVTARITITDPIGRSTHGTGTAPAVRINPTFPLRIIGDPKVSRLGVGIQLATKAPREPDWTLEISVTSKPSRFILRPRVVTWSSPLSKIPSERTPMTRDPIQVRYVEPTFRLPLRRDQGNYAVFIRLNPPFAFEARLVDPRGRATEVSVAVGSRRLIFTGRPNLPF